ncbi:uncharacterized protein VP01_8689g1, partial [Puccinia sorghi]
MLLIYFTVSIGVGTTAWVKFPPWWTPMAAERLHTPKTIFSNRGPVFISQILDWQLRIRLHPPTAFHRQTNGQSEISNKAVKQYLQHFV